MVDFAEAAKKIRLKRAMMGPKYPYAEDDAQYFAGRDMRSGTVEVTAEFRHDMAGDITAYAITEKGDRIELIFVGQRAEDFKTGLGAVLEDMHLTAILADDFAQTETFRVTTNVTGFWTQRRWKDREGQWHTRQQLTVSEWDYGTLSRGVEHRRHEGRTPITA
jgi:hypothetical protein